LSSFCVIPLSN